MFDTLPNTCGNCDTYETCKNPYKDVNILCSVASEMLNEKMNHYEINLDDCDQEVI